MERKLRLTALLNSPLGGDKCNIISQSGEEGSQHAGLFGTDTVSKPDGRKTGQESQTFS